MGSPLASQNQQNQLTSEEIAALQNMVATAPGAAGNVMQTQQPAPPPTTYSALQPILGNLPKGSGVNLNIPVVNPALEAFNTGQLSDLEALKAAFQPKFDESGNLIPGTGFATPSYADFMAGLDPNQSKAINLASSGVGSYQPFLDQASSLYGNAATAAGGLGGLAGTATGLSGQAMGVANMGADIATGMGTNIAGTGANLGFGLASDIANVAGGLEAGGAQAFDPMSVSNFMSPYTQDVIDSSLADIQRESDIARQRQRGEAVKSGAFGGSRQAVLDAELDRATLEQKAQTAAELRRAGFESAAQRAQEAFEAQQNRFLSANQLGLGSLAEAGQLGLGAGQLGLGAGELGLGAGELGLKGLTTGIAGLETAGNLTKDQVDALTGIGTNALEQSKISTALQGADIQMLLNTGQINQGQAQAILNAQRQDALNKTLDPFRFYNLIGDSGRGVPFQDTQLNVGGRVPSGGGGGGGSDFDFVKNLLGGD